MSRSPRIILILCVAVVSGWAAAASRAQESLFRVPDDAIAAWAIDAANEGRMQGAGRVAMGLMRAAVSSGVMGDDDAAEMIRGLLVLAAISGYPHRLVLADLAATLEGEDRHVEVQRLGVVLEIRDHPDHADLIRTVRALLVGTDTDEGSPGQRVLALPGGRTGVEFSRQGWDPWRRVAWVSAPGIFTVAVGDGALERWLEHPQQPADEPGALAVHRHAARGTAVGTTIAQLWVDLRRLRSAFPDTFIDGQGRRLSERWGLANARQFAVHVWRAPPQHGVSWIGMAGTWSAMTEPELSAHARSIADAAPPTWFNPAFTPDASAAVHLRPDWPALVEFVADTYGRYQSRDGGIRFEQDRRRWNARFGSALDRVLASLENELVVLDAPKGAGPLPGLGTYLVPVKEGVNRERLERDIDAVLGSFETVLRDEASGLWSVALVPKDLDPRGLLRIGALGVAQGRDRLWLIAGVEPGVVEEVRQAIEE